jgi:hypothetical protein
VVNVAAKVWREGVPALITRAEPVSALSQVLFRSRKADLGSNSAQRLGRLTAPCCQGHELLTTVVPDPYHASQAQLVFLEADVDVDHAGSSTTSLPA